MTTSIFLLLLLSAVQVSCVFNCYKCTTIGISDAGIQAAVAQFLSSYVSLLTMEQSCASNPVTQGGGCKLACVHLKLMIDFSQYAGPQISIYTPTQIRSLGKVPVSIRDCLEAQWPSSLIYVTWGYLPPVNPAKSCFSITGGIYGTPVVGRLCLSNTGNYTASNPDISDLTSSPAQPTATQPILPISFDNCAEAYMPNSNLGAILTVAGYRMPTLVNVSAIDPYLRTSKTMAQLQNTNNNINLSTCFFPNQVLAQGCIQAAYSAGIRINMTSYSGGDVLSSQMQLSQAQIQTFNFTSTVARGCITELPAKGFAVPISVPYPTIPEGDNCFDIQSNIWDLQLSSEICMCNKNGCNIHQFSPLLGSSATSKRIAISLIATPFLVSMSLIVW